MCHLLIYVIYNILISTDLLFILAEDISQFSSLNLFFRFYSLYRFTFVEMSHSM